MWEAHSCCTLAAAPTAAAGGANGRAARDELDALSRRGGARPGDRSTALSSPLGALHFPSASASVLMSLLLLLPPP